MARSGTKTVLCTITLPAAVGAAVDAGRDEYMERSAVPADQVPWKTDVWGRYRIDRGGELSLAGGVEAQPTVTFWFDYFDVMTPNEGDATNTVLRERMNIQAQDELGTSLGSFDIDLIRPDAEMRQEVEVRAIRKALAV